MKPVVAAGLGRHAGEGKGDVASTGGLARMRQLVHQASMIIVTGSVRLDPSHREHGFALGRAHSARSRAEGGCIAHDCMADSEDADRMMFLEYWRDMGALQAHFAVPESREFVREIAALAVSPPEMRIFEAEEIRRG